MTDHQEPDPDVGADETQEMEMPLPTASTPSSDRGAPDDSTQLAASAGPGPVTMPWQGWGRLARMGRPRLTKANILATLLAMLLGFGMVTQVQQYRSSGLENMRQEDLVTLLDGVNQQSGRLGSEIDRLTRTRDSLKAGGGDAAAIKAAEDRLSALGVLAGTVAASGPGIQMEITDPGLKLAPTNILDTVEELRDAGAEALQIGNVRVVASTWFGVSTGGKLVVDGHELDSPYVLTAIGDPHTMSTALAIPGGVLETLRQLGIATTVTSKQSIAVTALRSTNTPGYAQADTSQP